ncbi:RING-type E3 ubiquitin transferase [Salvia divinorum]|uniref:RING-type E3 ubiquitin transferase n=1 Tax=Salvia divinorum TaxID=28513 RepID=A0ABD1HNU7_SALDI
MSLIDRWWWESKQQPRQLFGKDCDCLWVASFLILNLSIAAGAKMEQGGALRYWCHMCSQTVNPIREMNCPVCESDFLEEMSDADPPSPNDRALSLWAPILLGFMARPSMDPDPEDHETATAADADADANQQLVRRQNSIAILQLLQSIRAGIVAADPDHNQDRERETGGGQHVILVNQIVGPSLDLLLQHLAENDPNRYGTPPAQREVVDALPSVTIHHPMQCAVCLDDCEEGAELKEMPCKHKFHDTCILPWLQLHSSCPVCRHQLPADDENNTSVADNGTTDNGTQFSVPLLWPFTALFSPSNSSHHTDN